MKSFIHSLQSLVNQEMVTKAATALGEKEINTAHAATMIYEGLLAILTKRVGHSPQVENLLHEAGNLDLMSHIQNLVDETPSADQRRIGDELLELLLGDNAYQLTDPIAADAGISKVATNRLVQMIAPALVGFLGKKITSGEMTKAQLFAELDKEKGNLLKGLPVRVINAFDLAPMEHEAAHVVEAAATVVAAASLPIPEPELELPPAPKPVGEIAAPPKTAKDPNVLPLKSPKKTHKWLWWLLLLLLLLLLLYWWRC